MLGLTFRQFGEEVRLMDPATGRDLPTHEDLLLAQRAAEARVAELEALLAKGGRDQQLPH